MWKHVPPPFVHRNGVWKKRGEKISIKLQHRLQRFIIVWCMRPEPFFLFFPSALLPVRDDMTTARWLLLLLWMLMPNNSRARRRRPLVWSTFFTVRCVCFFPSQNEILMVRRTTGYWLTVDMSDFFSPNKKERGIGYIQIGFPEGIKRPDGIPPCLIIISNAVHIQPSWHFKNNLEESSIHRSW